MNNLIRLFIFVQKLLIALGEVMGRPFTDQEAKDFQQIIGWTNNQILTYREWCGLCGAAERLMGGCLSLITLTVTCAFY